MSLELFTDTSPITVGIDPGQETTGIAIWNNKQMKFTDLMTKSFWETIKWMNQLKESRKTNSKGLVKHVQFWIENPYLNKPVFPIASETQMFKDAIIEQDEELQAKALRMFSRRAQNVGMNKELAKKMIEIARMKGFVVKEIRPSKSKINAEDFRQKTGWIGKGSQHARDAACLVFPI